MTLQKAGHNLQPQESAKKPVEETKTAPKDGPEGYLEDGPIKKSKEGKVGSPCADSISQSSEILAKHLRKQYIGKETSLSVKLPIPRPFEEFSNSRRIPPCRYGSPFAYLACQDKHDFFKGLLSKSTRVLFDQIVAEATEQREELLHDYSLTSNGFRGHLLFLRQGLPGIGSGSDSNETDLELDYMDFDEIQPIRLVSGSPTSDISPSTNGHPTAYKPIEICRVSHPKSRDFQYFVKKHEFNHVYINGIHMDHNINYGPLPDFAVLELGDFSYFWFRTPTALDYMPSPNRKRRRDSGGTSEGSSSKASKGNTNSSPSSLRSLFEDSNSEASNSPLSNSPPSQLPASNSPATQLPVSNLPVSPSPVNDSQVFPDSNSWRDEYRRRLEICMKRPIKYTSLITNVHPPHRFADGELHDPDVILAIGALWLGLKDANIDFAYADVNFFSLARSERMVGMQAVNGPNHFIMPLIYSTGLEDVSPEVEEDTAEPSEPVFSAFQRGEKTKYKGTFAAVDKAKQADPGNKNKPPPSIQEQEVLNKHHKGGIGHLLLAVAEKVHRNRSSTIKDRPANQALVRLRFMDSGSRFTNKEKIRRVARNIVRNSGWLGDTWPYFDASEEYWMDVLEQTGSKDCGVHTILNAWAYMLGIPLATGRERRLGYQTYSQARELISIALQGQLDSLTIRAWMQHSGFAKDQSLTQLQQTEKENPASPSTFPNMQTVAVNEVAFIELVEEIDALQQVINSSQQAIKSPQQAIKSPQQASKSPPQASKSPQEAVNSPGAGSVGIEQSVHASETATGPTISPSIQAPAAGSSSAHISSTGATSPAKISSPTQPSINSPSTWEQSFARGVKCNRTIRNLHPRTSQDAGKNATTIPSIANMDFNDVILAIATIWEGLKRLGRPEFDFTYAGMDVLYPGSGYPWVGAVGRWTRFIMPMFFPATIAGKNDNQGHLLLCVAELVNEHPMTVRLEIYDSRPDKVPKETIKQHGRRIIVESGWLGVNASTNPVVYTRSVSVPSQVVGANACGLHVILNAWSVMLGIPIHPHPLRRGRVEGQKNNAKDREFLHYGHEIINLALGGFMDSPTIQAYLNFFNYSLEQRIGDPVRAVVPMTAVGMNPLKFFRTLQKRQESLLLTAARAENRKFSDLDLESVMDFGMNKEQAWKALVMTNGEFGKAIDWVEEPEGPEDALSPKTPERELRV